MFPARDWGSDISLGELSETQETLERFLNPQAVASNVVYAAPFVMMQDNDSDLDDALLICDDDMFSDDDDLPTLESVRHQVRQHHQSPEQDQLNQNIQMVLM